MILLCEGLDNVGKDTQIKNIQPLLTDLPLHVLHYSNYKGFNSVEESKNYSKMVYNNMFNILKNESPFNHFILNRSHIGEFVYSNMYRNYCGDYIFEFEEYWKSRFENWNDIYLITFIDEVENLIKRDDGESHSIDPIKKQVEIDKFIEATNRSIISNKIIININNKNSLQVFDEIKLFLRK